MANYYLKNFIKTSSNSYQNYKMIAISYRINSETTSNRITNSINGITYELIPMLPTNFNYYKIIDAGNGNQLLYDLKVSDIYRDNPSIASNNICKILDSNYSYIWYINFATINTDGSVKFATSNGGGISNAPNGINLNIDINTNSISDPNLPALSNVTLWGVNSASYCPDTPSKTVIGHDINPSYGI
jgi:hypothetical protein